MKIIYFTYTSHPYKKRFQKQYFESNAQKMTILQIAPYKF